MRGAEQGTKLMLLVLASQLIAASDALAYLDPGTGSFIFQAVIALVVGAAFTVRLYWQRIRYFLGRKERESSRIAREREKNEDGRP